MKKSKTEKKSEIKLKPGVLNYILPNFIMTKNNKYSKYMNASEDILKKKMSYDNIFRHLIQYERLKKVLFTEDQNKLINNFPKVQVKTLIDQPLLDKNELLQTVSSIDMNCQDKINKNLLNIFFDI